MSNQQATDKDRYQAEEMTNGQTLIYDRENGDAWIRSSITIENCQFKP